jgi:glucose-1-phosphate cytidylyltransferase
MKVDCKEVPVFILCGGLGTRIKEETELKPKPMVTIGNRPILWHIMKTYHSFGFKKFILCLGFKAEVVKDYFLNYRTMNSDFTIHLATNEMVVNSVDHQEEWEVTLAYTGELTMTGARIAIAAEKYLHASSHFAVTYGDGLTDANLAEEYAFHLEQNKIGTVLGVNPPSRFGEIRTDGEKVSEFSEKPEFKENWINGGYFFFKKEFLNYLSKKEECILEKAPLVNLAQDGELNLFRHRGFWACMDTQRDRDSLNQLWNTGKAPWKHFPQQNIQSVIHHGESSCHRA